MFSKLQMGSVIRILKAYGLPIERLVDAIPALARVRDAHDNYTKEKTARRLERKTDRENFIRYLDQDVLPTICSNGGLVTSYITTTSGA